jgi:hypothetical protein
MENPMTATALETTYAPDRAALGDARPGPAGPSRTGPLTQAFAAAVLAEQARRGEALDAAALTRLGIDPARVGRR